MLMFEIEWIAFGNSKIRVCVRDERVCLV